MNLVMLSPKVTNSQPLSVFCKPASSHTVDPIFGFAAPAALLGSKPLPPLDETAFGITVVFRLALPEVGGNESPLVPPYVWNRREPRPLALAAAVLLPASGVAVGSNCVVLPNRLDMMELMECEMRTSWCNSFRFRCIRKSIARMGKDSEIASERKG